MRYLEREGYATLEADDGDDARALVERDSPDLVVLDVMLPGTDGLELCRWIRARSELPVIMLTARGEEADRIVGLELGADDYVTKPFSPRELAARVRTVLRRTHAAAVATRAARVRRRRARRRRPARCARRGVEVRLTAKEFDLLWFLASHPRRVFGRDQLMSRVWGYEAALDTGTVTVHVRRLREKIEDDPSDAAPPPDRLGRRLPARAVMPVAMIGTGDRGRRCSRSQSASSPSLLAAAPPEPPAAARRARRALGLPPARVGAALRLGRVPHGRRREDPRRLGRVRDRRGRRGARPRAVDRAARSSASATRPRELAARRPQRARAGVGTGRGRGPRRVVQRDGGEPRAALRRAPRARRVGEPRPAHAAREHAGDARGARGRPRRARDDYCPSSASRSRSSRRSSTTCSSSRGSTRARSPSSCATRRSSRSSSRACAASRPRRDGEASGSPRASPTTCSARFAPEKIERVLFNLLTNALRHTPSDGSVAVRVEQVDREVQRQRRGHRRGARRGGARSGCSTASGAAIRRARRAAPASVSRSRAGSSRRTADGSGPRAARAAGARVSFTLPGAV